jgi:ElaB/YqjD/DUF883 family membrane-anchored ribosome-binding protein
MRQTIEANVQTLTEEMKHLREDFARIGEILKDTARHGTQDATDTVRETAEQGWYDVKAKAQLLLEEIEQRPMRSALIIFGAGVVLGRLVARR